MGLGSEAGVDEEDAESELDAATAAGAIRRSASDPSGHPGVRVQDVLGFDDHKVLR